jgi:hypothetical protein
VVLALGLTALAWAAPAQQREAREREAKEVQAKELQAKELQAKELAAKELEAKEVQAKKACLASRPDRGIELLAELYAETNDATYIYNQARCYQQNGRAQDAATRFREYLRKSPSVDPAEKAQVQGYIAELEAQARPSPPSASPTVPAPIAAGALPAPGATVTTTSAPSGGASPRSSASRWRLVGVVTGSIGALALAGGIYMGTRARALSDEVTSDGSRGTFSPSKYDQGRRAETLQWVGAGVGAAALAGGALLYLLGGRAHDETTGSVAALPAIAPGTAGAMVRVRF